MKNVDQKVRLPLDEERVCRRLIQIRKFRNLSQADAARVSTIPRTTWANYEAFRTPLSVISGLKISYALLVNEKWLATGKGSTTPCAGLLLDGEKLSQISTDATYLEAYKASLKNTYTDLARCRVGDIYLRLLRSSTKSDRREAIFSSFTRMASLVRTLNDAVNATLHGELGDSNPMDHMNMDTEGMMYEAGLLAIMQRWGEHIPTLEELDTSREMLGVSGTALAAKIIPKK